MKNDVSNVEKASEVQGANVHSPIKNVLLNEIDKIEEVKEDDNFADVFDGLEEMSNNSTLFDDDDDAPPPLPGSKNLVGNNEKSVAQEERGQN